MANPFTQKVRQRKFIYTALILVLFTGSLMHRRFIVEPEAERLRLREVTKGEVELTSSAVRLTLTGSRGLAVTFLWASALEQQEKHEWNELELLVGAITKLQPYFITPWLFQGWNLAYNVAVECDMPRDKYYYVSRGLKLLGEGERRNQEQVIGQEQGIGQPDLRHFIGVAYQGKIGTSDEKNAMRCLLELSCIDPVRRNPERFLEVVDGRQSVNLAELAKFTRDHPRLVRMLREKLGYTQPKQIVDFLADNSEVPSRYESTDGGLEQRETPLMSDHRDQFPILPPPTADIQPNPSAPDFGLGAENMDIFLVCRAWYTYAQASLPPAVPDASHEEGRDYDRSKYRLPKAPAIPIFRGYPARAQAYHAEVLEENGWFDEDGWVVRDWFDRAAFGEEEFRVGTESKYHAGPAWSRAYTMYHDLGVKIGLYLSPSEIRALDEQAQLFRDTFKYTKVQAHPNPLPAAYRKDEKMQASWRAHEKLFWKDSIGNMTNFNGHHATSEAERTAEAVLARKLFFKAERLRRFDNDPEQALDLYAQAWPVWLTVLVRHPQFANLSNIQEDFYELQLKHLRLAQTQRGRELKAAIMGVAQSALWPPLPLDDMLTANEKNRILEIRTVQGLLEWARGYDMPQRDEVSRFLLGWTQAAGVPGAGTPRLFLFPGQDNWTLMTLTSRSTALQPGWRHFMSDDNIYLVKTRLGLIRSEPTPEQMSMQRMSQ
jgi:hypothetical protein